MRLFLRFLLCSLVAVCLLGAASARGQGCPPQYAQNFDGVQPPALPAGWTAAQGMNVTGAPLWITSAINSDTPPNAAFSTAPDNVLDNRLDTPALYVGTFDFSLSFSHSYNLEAGFDGAVLEISNASINGGAFTDVTDPAVGGHFAPGTGYNTTIGAMSQSPIAGRMAWGGNSNGYNRCTLTFGMPFDPGFFGSTILRFRLVTNDSGASGGWRVDTFRMDHAECNPPSPTPAAPTPTPTATPTATVTPPATPTPSPTATPLPGPAQALNISTRLRVESGDRVMIGGFIITGPEPKRVAIRGIGPSLGNSGLSDLLADPTLELRDYDGVLLRSNDDWQDDPAHAAELTALGLELQDPKESGMVVTLQPGAYTVLMAGKNQTSGIGLVEIYDADAAAASQLANISTRGFVRTGDNVMIGGFILGNGSADADVVVRALGPSLSRFMLIDVVADPTLELRDANGALLIANDDWQDDPASAAQLVAYNLQPIHPAESAIFASLPPGAFTAILAGKNDDIGVALVELYRLHALVTSTADSGPGSLRNAIAAARDGDTIQFDPALNGQAIELTSGELVIDKSIAIQGFQLYPLPVQRSAAGGTPAFRIFHVTPGHTVTIQGLTISNGFTQGGPPENWGGGIYNDGSSLAIADCVISGNSAGSTGIPGSGAGIFNNSINSGHADLTISNSTVSGNSAHSNIFDSGSTGGGIHNNGAGQLHHATVVVNNTTISGNSASSGAGICNYGFYTGNASLVVNSSTISGNAANSGGGISNVGSFKSGNASVTVSNSTISGNSAMIGGAIVNSGEGGSATLEIANSTISDNSAVEQGGGLYNTGGAAAAHSGGGIYPSGSGGSAAVLRNTILKTGISGENIYNNLGDVSSAGHNLSNDNAGGFLTATGDQINTNPMLGPLENNGGPTFTHELLTGSPAINAGDPNFIPPPSNDQRGLGYQRVIGGRIDVGSFEFRPAARPPGSSQ